MRSSGGRKQALSRVSKKGGGGNERGTAFYQIIQKNNRRESKESIWQGSLDETSEGS